MDPLPKVESYGKISFIDSTQDFSASVTDKNLLVEMDVLSAVVAPNGNVMETRIYAWNGKYDEDFRSMILTFTGTFDDFPPGNTFGVNVKYIRNGQTSFAPDYLPVNPTFHFNFSEFQTQVQTPLINSASVPFIINQMNVNTLAANRSLSYSSSEININGYKLYDFNLNISSFGGINIPLNSCVTFDVNGKSGGSFHDQNGFCNQAMSANDFKRGIPGILKMESTFTPDSRNPLQSLVIEFKHTSGKLAYLGPVGKYDLPDNSDFTEIKVTAIDENGTIYREQKGKGYVKAISEDIWQKDNSGVLYPGHIVLKFEFDLVSDAGTVLNITNGNAFFSTN